MTEFSVSSAIRAFLLNIRGQCCENCLTDGTQLEPAAVRDAFKPSKHNPYSFMTAQCAHCGQTAFCVAYAGETDTVRERDSIGRLIRSGLAVDGISGRSS